MFCIAFLVRTYISAPITQLLSPRIINKRLHGAARGLATTLLGVAISSPITGAIMTMLFSTPDDFTSTYVSSLMVTMPMTVIVNYFFVGPAAKLMFHNRITPVKGIRILRTLDKYALSFLRLFGM